MLLVLLCLNLNCSELIWQIVILRVLSVQPMLDLEWLKVKLNKLNAILKLEVTKISKEFWILISKFIALKNVPVKKNIMFSEPLNSLMRVQFVELVSTLVLLQMTKVEKCIFL